MTMRQSPPRGSIPRKLFRSTGIPLVAAIMLLDYAVGVASNTAANNSHKNLTRTIPTAVIPTTPIPARIPLVGLGCASGVRQAHVTTALQAGYRFLDTAQSYAWGYHEQEVGAAVQEFTNDDDDDDNNNHHHHHDNNKVWIQTKIHPQDLGYNATRAAVQLSLQRLQRTTLDSVLIHKPRCWKGACHKEPQGTWQDSWQALQEFVQAGVIRAIGICDVVDDALLDELLQQRIHPHIIQNWMDPYHQGTKMRQRIQDAGILFQAYSSLGTQWVHHRGYSKNPVLNNPTLTALAEKYKVGVAQVILRWGTQHGVSMLPASKDATRQVQNLLDTFTFTLTTLEMVTIDALDGTAPPPDQPEKSKKMKDPNQVSLVFENQVDAVVDSFWIDSSNNDKKEIHVGSIQPLSTMGVNSFDGHEFFFRTQPDGTLVGQHVVAKELGPQQRHVIASIVEEEEL